MPMTPPTSTERMSSPRSRTAPTSAPSRALAGDDALPGRPAGARRRKARPAAHDVGAGARLREGGEHAEIRVRLDGVADDVRHVGERTVIRGEGRQQRRLRVDVRGRADPVREGAKRDALARELSVAIGEVVHLRVVTDVFPRDRSIRPRRSQGTLTVTSPDRALSSGRALAFSAVTA